MKYLEYLTVLCFVAGIILSAATDMTAIGLYLFAAGVAVAIVRSLAGETMGGSEETTRTPQP